MIKKFICGAMLAALGTLAQAATVAPTEWEFTWQGFYVFQGFDGYDDPGLLFTGKFAGIDGNADGILAQDELTSLTFQDDTINYAACPANTPTFSCRLTSFSYSAAGGLAFGAGNTRYSAAPGTQDWWSGESIDYDTSYGIYEWHFGYQMPGEQYSMDFASYTVKTVTQISPVPEPGTYAMLGAGLLVLAGLRRARRK